MKKSQSKIVQHLNRRPLRLIIGVPRSPGVLRVQRGQAKGWLFCERCYCPSLHHIWPFIWRHKSCDPIYTNLGVNLTPHPEPPLELCGPIWASLILCPFKHNTELRRPIATGYNLPEETFGVYPSKVRIHLLPFQSHWSPRGCQAQDWVVCPLDFKDASGSTRSVLTSSAREIVHQFLPRSFHKAPSCCNLKQVFLGIPIFGPALPLCFNLALISEMFKCTRKNSEGGQLTPLL